MSRNPSLAYHLIVTITLIALVVGCGRSEGDPTAPATLDTGPGATNLAGESASAPSANSPGGRIVWGYYDVLLDMETGSVEVIPLRHSAFTFNVTMFLQAPAGNPNNLGVTIQDASQFRTTGRIDLNVSLTHPFPGAQKLRGFDVMGVLMGNGSLSGFADPSVVYPAAGFDPILLNADGYTRWMNATEFTQPGLVGFTPGSKGIPGFVPSSTINGYKWYSEFLGVTDDLVTFLQTPINVQARGSFKAGSTLTRRFEIRFPIWGGSPVVRFQYAVLAGWAKPGVPNPGVNDFPPAANLQEPFHISVADNGSDLWYVDPTTLGGNLRLRLEIFDWQGAANPAGVRGELSSLWIEDAGGTVFPTGAYDALATAIVTAGTGCSSVFTVDIPGCTPQWSGPQEFLIAADSASPFDYDQGFGTPYPIVAPLAAFTRYTATVLNYQPCPQPALTSLQQSVVNVNDVMPGFTFGGSNFQSGPQLAAQFRRVTGNVVGTNVQVSSPTAGQADFDFSAVSAGMYDFYFMNGCGTPAPIWMGALEVNTPPTSTGITGPASGDATLTAATYNANATDADTDPVDTLTYSWTVWDPVSMTNVVGPTPGDPFVFSYAPLAVGLYDVRSTVSDGYPPADLPLTYPISRDNTQPSVTTPAGPTPVWINAVQVYSVVGTELDPGQTLTYTWSVVPQGNPSIYTIPGDPIPGDLTIDFSTAPYIPGPGWYDIECQVDDGSGWPNATATSPSPLTIYVATLPYSDPIPASQLSQVVAPAWPSLQGMASCPSFWDGFFGPPFAMPFAHPDISILSGPSLVVPGVMVIADEPGVIAGPYPPPPPQLMGFAHFTCPFATGNLPSWIWWTMGLFPGGPDMIPSVIHFDGSSQGEMLFTNSQMTRKLGPIPAPDDPSAFQHYMVGGAWLNDLYTSLPWAGSPDVAVDMTAGFDMGSPSAPMNADLYGLYTHDLSGILASCGGAPPGPPVPFDVHFLQFPSMGVQPPGTPVDVPGSLGVVAPLPFAMTGPGPGLFGIVGGVAVPGGPLIFPEPYYALAIDDDPADNPYPCNLPPPVNWWVMAAAIDADRDLEIYEIDFGVAPPGPAGILPYASMPMGSFLGGNPSAYPLDCEFISNFSGFGGTIKPMWTEDLLAVLLADPLLGVWQVEVYAIAPNSPVPVSASTPVATPPVMYPVGGVAYRLDVDEVTGELYVIHDDAAGSGSMSVTIIPY